jgi:GNAT superfamily N-acetyltransferase
MAEVYRRTESDFESADASALLELAWPAPALRYTPEGLLWQSNFPEAGPWVSLRDESIYAFGGATRRRVLLPNGDRLNVPLLSFIAVAPERRGQGHARHVYRELLQGLEGPILTFALAASAGADLIERVYPEAGYCLHPLASCAIYARMTGKAQNPPGWTLETLGQTPPSQAWPGVLVSDPSREEWEHWHLDPRPHAGFLASGSCADGERHEVWFWLVEQQVRTGQGIRSQWIVETWGGSASPEAHQAAWQTLVCSLSAGNAALPPIPVLQANNLTALSPDLLRLGGWRQIGSPFQSWIATRGPQDFTGIQASNLPVL